MLKPIKPSKTIQVPVTREQRRKEIAAYESEIHHKIIGAIGAITFMPKEKQMEVLAYRADNAFMENVFFTLASSPDFYALMKFALTNTKNEKGETIFENAQRMKEEFDATKDK